MSVTDDDNKQDEKPGWYSQGSEEGLETFSVRIRKRKKATESHTDTRHHDLEQSSESTRNGTTEMSPDPCWTGRHSKLNKATLTMGCGAKEASQLLPGGEQCGRSAEARDSVK